MTSEIKGYCSYMGNRYPIYIEVDQSRKKPEMTFEKDRFICLCRSEEDVDLTKPLMTFYKKACKKYVEKRLRHYIKDFKTNYRGFSISSDDTRWGSCDSNRNLTFHWKLMMFPPKAIDYVIVHELCHLTHLNHDRSFWRLVGKYCPDYLETMKILGASKTRDL